MEADASAQTAELAAAQQTVSQLESRVATSEAARAVLNSQVSTLREQLRAAHAELDSEHATRAGTEEEVVSLRGELAAAEAAAAEAQQRLDGLRGQQLSAVSGTSDEVAAVSAELAAERKLVEQLRDAANESEQQTRLLREELQSVQARIGGMQVSDEAGCWASVHFVCACCAGSSITHRRMNQHHPFPCSVCLALLVQPFSSLLDVDARMQPYDFPHPCCAGGRRGSSAGAG